jgi:hypothetical protein
MRPLANIPIEQKLRLLVAVVVALTLMAGGGVFVPWALKRFALEQEGELRSMAASVGFSASFSMDGLELNPDRME